MQATVRGRGLNGRVSQALGSIDSWVRRVDGGGKLSCVNVDRVASFVDELMMGGIIIGKEEVRGGGVV